MNSDPKATEMAGPTQIPMTGHVATGTPVMGIMQNPIHMAMMIIIAKVSRYLILRRHNVLP